MPVARAAAAARIAEVALSLTLMVGAAVLGRSLFTLLSVEPGR